MPVTLVDRLPLPNLKVYSAGSVALLAVAVYHAMSATGAPGWRVNATLRHDAAAAGDELGAELAAAALDAANGTRNLTEQLADVVTYMMQEPLCMWTVINASYCSLALCALALQRAVFGPLRVAEAQRVKDKLWNYVFYKFIFVFGVLNVQYMDEVLLWVAWFSLLGFLHLFGQLCKDRYEYLSSSPARARGAHARLSALLVVIAAAAGALLAAAARADPPAGHDTLAFMAAECVLVLLSALHVCARYALRLRDADAAGPLAYYTHLVFDACSLVVELAHVVHMVVFSKLVVSMPSLVLLMQLRHLLHELQARVRRHRLYTALAGHMSRHYPMASKEEVDKNQDNCAICWEPMKEARKLPCSHLFHNSCLCQWVQQDASCPTCRRALHAGPHAPALGPAPGVPGPRGPRRPQDAPPPPLAAHPNHLFHFDGSRYVSWLPSFSVEVTRVRPVLLAGAPALSDARLDAMAAQVQQLFPHYSLAQLAADLSRTRSPDLTVDNILEGRLPAPAPAPLPSLSHALPAPAPARTDASSATDAISAPETMVLLTAADAPPPPPARDAATSTEERLAPPPPLAHPAPLHPLADDLSPSAATQSSSWFSKQAPEREGLLQRRKQLLIASARRKYLEKVAARGAGARS